MRRRTLLKRMVASTGTLGLRLPLAFASQQDSKLYVFVQAGGGWDPTSFCDPKANTAGEPVINHWAERDEVQQAGNIPYAPFAKNREFFDKYYDRMLVINGVDAQTNSHTVGVTHNWSGRNAVGYPTLSALLAARYAPDLPVAYLSFGGFSDTAGIARFTRMNNADLLRNIAAPELRDGDEEHRLFVHRDWRLLQSYRAATDARLAATPNLLPDAVRNLDYYRSAFLTAEGLKAYAATIPPNDQLEQADEYETPKGYRFWSELRRQAQLVVLAFKSGVAVSADLHLGGFDTHDDHDASQGWLLGNLTSSVDFLWDYAEQHGVADRLVVVLGSDFGRTNFYNSQEGKDHWPIGSYIVMEKHQRWTNQVIGETDGLHFAHRINAETLECDDTNGTIIYPKHVHKALRRYLGVEGTPEAQRFPFNNTEDLAFFG